MYIILLSLPYLPSLLSTRLFLHTLALVFSLCGLVVLQQEQTFLLGGLLVDITLVLFNKLSQDLLVCLVLQLEEDLLDHEERLLVLDHALHHVVFLQNFEELVNNSL